MFNLDEYQIAKSLDDDAHFTWTCSRFIAKVQEAG
jgi:hypothetical protein